MRRYIWKREVAIGIFIIFIGVSIFSAESTNIRIEQPDEITEDFEKYNSLNLNAQNWLEHVKLTASDGDEFSWFGYSVCIDGNYAIVGAYQKNSGVGAAYVFKKEGESWTQQQKVVASDGDPHDSFGISVSIDEDYAVIGAFSDNENGEDSGAAYIFKRTGTTWSQQQKLIASDGAIDDRFGNSVAIDGEYVVIGSSEDDNLRGSSYVFKRTDSTWNEQQKLTASDGANGDLFGCSVQMDGEYIIIGASGDDDDGEYSGSAYIYKRDGSVWSQQQKLNPTDGEYGLLFGYSVSMDGEQVLIGAIGDDYATGSAYIFTRAGSIWSQTQKLQAYDATVEDWFGNSVSIDSGYAFVGAPGDDDNGDGSGSVYVFQLSGAKLTDSQKLTASDGDEEDQFGHSVSSDGNNAIIGAYFDADSGESSGSAYIFINEVNSDLICDGELEWDQVKPESAVTGSFTIENIGDAGSELDWEISEYPDWGEWTFIPLNGEDLPPGEPFTIQVIVVAPETTNKGFAGFIKVVNKDNIEDFCQVPVTLTTPKNKSFIVNYSIMNWLLEQFPNVFPILRYSLG